MLDLGVVRLVVHKVSACALVGGDGDKRILIEEIREQHGLHNRVQLLGLVKHENVRQVCFMPTICT